MDLDGGDVEDSIGVEGRETIIRIYCMGKTIFNKIEKKKIYGCTHSPV